jgi:hypothetical protein
MHRNVKQANAITAGLWMIGIGIMFGTHFWWPAILMFVALTILVQGWSYGRQWDALHGAFWMLLIAVWAVFKFNMTFFFVALGVYMIFAALFRPDVIRKPYVDNTLE